MSSRITLLFRLLVSCCIISTVSSLDAQWTSYSDRASLPRSKAWRDNMKKKLLKLDMSTLAAEDRRKAQKLLKMLKEDEHVVDDLGYDFGFSMDEVAPFIFLGVAVIAMAAFNARNNYNNGQKLGYGGEPFAKPFADDDSDLNTREVFKASSKNADQILQARLARFSRKET
eukprot:m.175172 g.175172  ORF g.175172 m.175172 type:complete len:171 (+) comp15420_c0_seq2:337-849(+)